MTLTVLLIVTGMIAVAGLLFALDGSRDVFHPLVLLGPMLAFLYGYMPWKLVDSGVLPRFFDTEQLIHVQTVNLLGVSALILGCLAAGARVRNSSQRSVSPPQQRETLRLLVGGAIAGGIGLVCWLITIINVGGFVAAYSTSYSGGDDASGYIRDGSMLLLVGLMMAVMSRSAGGPRWPAYVLMVLFGAPWLSTAILMARRGPTFEIVVVVLMAWYINRKKRPPLVTVGCVGLGIGWMVLFLVSNRQNIYLGSDKSMTTDVGSVVNRPDNGNEWIYGAGAMLSAERQDHYFWMRRYAAQLLVRPIPSALWPTKYEDFGVPELLYNAGTGGGFGDTLGWEGAVGAAPGIVADLWLEVWWFAVPLMGVIGWIYGYTWSKAVQEGGAWSSQFVVLSAITIYLVMQTMEAVLFRTLLLSIPCWIIWRWARSSSKQRRTTLRRSLAGPRGEPGERRRFQHA